MLESGWISQKVSKSPNIGMTFMQDSYGERLLAITCGYEGCYDLDVQRFDAAFELACGRLPKSSRYLMPQTTVSRL